MSFGRKGLAPGEPITPLSLRGTPAPVDREPPVSPALAAFLAAERAKAGSAPGLSEMALSAAPPRDGIEPPRPPRAAGAPKASGGGAKALPIAYILWWFLGIFGAHRFYLRAYRSGAVQLALLPLLIVVGMLIGGTALGVAASTTLVPLWFIVMLGWWVVDAFLIPGLTRKANEDPAHLVFA